MVIFVFRFTKKSNYWRIQSEKRERKNTRTKDL